MCSQLNFNPQYYQQWSPSHPDDSMWGELIPSCNPSNGQWQRQWQWQRQRQRNPDPDDSMWGEVIPSGNPSIALLQYLPLHFCPCLNDDHDGNSNNDADEGEPHHHCWFFSEMPILWLTLNNDDNDDGNGNNDDDGVHLQRCRYLWLMLS